MLELDPVLTALDSIYLHAVFIQNPCLGKLGAEVETRLAAEVRKKRVGAFFLDYLGKSCKVERLDIGYIGNVRIGHYRSRI